MALWFKHAQDSDEEKEGGGGEAGGSSAMEEDEEEEELPSQEFRVESVKLLLELDETTDVATEVRTCIPIMNMALSACSAGKLVCAHGSD